MRMIDLNLEKIKQAHDEDQQAYKRTSSASPQHIHRLWLLRYIEKLQRQLDEKENTS